MIHCRRTSYETLYRSYILFSIIIFTQGYVRFRWVLTCTHNNNRAGTVMLLNAKAPTFSLDVPTIPADLQLSGEAADLAPCHLSIPAAHLRLKDPAIPEVVNLPHYASTTGSSKLEIPCCWDFNTSSYICSDYYSVLQLLSQKR